MNILLTGGTGFIGSAFLKLALARGHRIAALVRPETLASRQLPEHENLVWIPGSLAEAPFEPLAVFAPEACVHAAWIATPGVYLESPENEDWVRWSLAFLKQARAAGARRLVVLGTCIEYQIAGRARLREDMPVAPQSLYARCKNALRLALEEEARRENFSLCWGRVFYPYGPGEHPARLCSSLLRQLAQDQPLVLKTPESTKDYIYIDDLAAAVLAVVESEVTGPLNLGTGEGVTVRVLAETAAGLLGRTSASVEAAESPAADPLGYVVADASRLRSLGWQPKWDLARGLTQLAASFDEARLCAARNP